ncbi:MAG: AMP-binding protein [Pseudomonadota bacterium]
MKQLKQLSSIVNDDQAFIAGAVVACGAKEITTWSDFLAKVEQWRGTVEVCAGRHVAVHIAELDEFLACIWTCWRLGKIPVVSSNAFRDLGDVVQGLPATMASQIDAGSFVAGIVLRENIAVDQQSDKAPAILLFTSGSSGTPQKVEKHFFQLEAELAALEAMWGAKVEGTVFASMVSHHHMFGLPFGVLWPLLRGSPFWTTKIQYAETLERLASEHAVTLIASPVQLDNLHDGLDWNLLCVRVKQIFSAGAPLSLAAADYCRQHFGHAVTEIYGSTETGAVAWRAQPEQTLWQGLPGVRVRQDQGAAQLSINSPSITTATDHWLTVADTGSVHADGRFELLGRSDQIVKVGGKRISLVALDTALARHPWVKQVRTVVLAARKHRLGAVISLSADGNQQLVDTGRSTVIQLLRSQLEHDFDRVALPRYWRFVSKLPINTEGKTTQHALVTLFSDDADRKLPDLLSNEVLADARHHRLTFSIPEDLHYFSGHFPGSPVLPGVVQLAWAIHYGKQCFNSLGIFSHLEVIKFQHVIVPNREVSLDLQWQPDQGKLVFAFSSAGAQHSSGRILFRQP